MYHSHMNTRDAQLDSDEGKGETLGKFLRRTREQKGMSLGSVCDMASQLAIERGWAEEGKTFVMKSLLSRWENDVPPAQDDKSAQRIALLADVLGVNKETLIARQSVTIRNRMKDITRPRSAVGGILNPTSLADIIPPELKSPLLAQVMAGPDASKEEISKIDHQIRYARGSGEPPDAELLRKVQKAIPKAKELFEEHGGMRLRRSGDIVRTSAERREAPPAENEWRLTGPGGIAVVMRLTYDQARKLFVDDQHTQRIFPDPHDGQQLRIPIPQEALLECVPSQVKTAILLEALMGTKQPGVSV